MEINNIIERNGSVYDHYSIFQQDVVFSFKGPFTGLSISLICKYIKSRVKEDKARRRLMNILIELGRNIGFYSAELDVLNEEAGKSGVGSLIIKESAEGYIIITGNTVLKSVEPFIREKIDKINNLDRIKLRKYKRELRNLPVKKNGSVNYGLAQIALVSRNSLFYQFVPLNDNESYYILTVNIEKIHHLFN